MLTLDIERLKVYRARTYRLLPGLRIHSPEQAVEYVNQRGFIFFWRITGIDFPSLWSAVAGDRPVANEHDDPGHITWRWKDDLLGKHRWYYARVLRRRNTIISLETAPYFYALSPNYGDPEKDYLEQYHQGLMTAEARAVYEALLNQGALDLLSLRRAANLWGTHNDTRFNRALDQLQIEFKVLPTGVSSAGAWRYAFIYDLTSRHYPELQQQARPITEIQARRRLALDCLRSVGASPFNPIARLFGWRSEECRRALDALIAEGTLIGGVKINGSNEAGFSLPELL